MSVTATATTGARADDHLWRALAEARRDGRRRTASHVEDALFRFHLPLARQLAAGHPDLPTGRAADAAEVALCRAILRWSPGRDYSFAPWAAEQIGDELRRSGQMVATEPPSTR